MSDRRAAHYAMRIGWCALAALVGALPACGYEWTVIPAGAGGGPDGGSASSGRACNSSKSCPAGEYCVFSDARCGTGAAGTCTAMPASSACAQKAESVCTCTGQWMSSRCEAASQGVDLADNTACKGAAAGGTFPCGGTVCWDGSFCVETTGSGTNGYECVKFSCFERTCACKEIAARCSGALCEAPSAGGVVVHCK